MTPSTALLTGIIFLVAIVFSMLGQGGGTLYTPVQVLFGIDFTYCRQHQPVYDHGCFAVRHSGFS